jgi:histidinol phosphatase-like enzyme
MNIYVDIDGTITEKNDETDYTKAKPVYKNIEKINKLYDQGYKITYWTGRGTLTKINWQQITQQQLNDWGAKYHNLLMGKPAYDLFIDDKSINSQVYFL